MHGKVDAATRVETEKATEAIFTHIYIYMFCRSVEGEGTGPHFCLEEKVWKRMKLKWRTRERAYVARQRLDVRRTVLLQWSNMVEEKMVSSGQWEASL